MESNSGRWDESRPLDPISNSLALNFYLNYSRNHGLQGLLDESHGADAEEDVLQEAGRARVSVGGRQQDVLEAVGLTELGFQTRDHLVE